MQLKKEVNVQLLEVYKHCDRGECAIAGNMLSTSLQG